MAGTRRGMARTVELANAPLATLAAQQLKIAGQIPDTDQVEEIQLEYTISATSDSPSQSQFFFTTEAQRDAFIDSLFGGGSGRRLRVQSPSLQELIDPQLLPSEYFRTIGAALQIYPEGPMVAAIGGQQINGIGFPISAPGVITETIVRFRIPFAAWRKSYLGNLFSPLAGQFQSGGIILGVNDATFTDGTSGNPTWTYTAINLRVLAVVRPSGARAGLVSPPRVIKNVSSTRVTELGGNALGLQLYMGTLNNLALGLEQAQSNGRVEVKIDGLTTQSMADSSPSWFKRQHLDDCYDSFGVLQRVLAQQDAGSSGVGNTPSLGGADYLNTLDMPLIWLGSEKQLTYCTVASDRVVITVQSEWQTQTPNVEFVSVVVWPLANIGKKLDCCAADIDIMSAPVILPGTGEVPAEVAANYLPRFVPA